MPEDAGYLIVRIAELTAELDMDLAIRTCLVGMIIAGIICIILNAVYLRVKGRDPWYDPIYNWGVAIIGVVLILLALIYLYIAVNDIIAIEEQISSLKAAYEQLYGPLPEGVL